MTGSVLVATDLSARSDRAVERALLLGRQLSTSVMILHVIESGKQLTNDEEDQLRELLRYEFGLTDDAVEISFAYGSVPPTIATFAVERDCSVIVTGVARFNHLRDFVLGTAVDYLIRQSTRPILIVKRRPRRSYERLIVATDFSPAAKTALLVSAELFAKAKVKLVHAYQASFEAFLDHDTTAPFNRDEAEEKMKRLLAELPEGLRLRVETVIQEGRAADVLTKNVGNRGGDLLVLGTWHRRRHAHSMGSEDVWTLPSTEPCDILIVGKANPAASPSDQTTIGQAVVEARDE